MALRMTEEEYAEWKKRQENSARCIFAHGMNGALAATMGIINEKPKRQKYGNQRVEVDGIKFDSKHEAAIYQELMLRVRAGELRTVCRQVKFDLPGGIVYVADFVAIRPDFTIEGVYDAKAPSQSRTGRTSTRKSR